MSQDARLRAGATLTILSVAVFIACTAACAAAASINGVYALGAPNRPIPEDVLRNPYVDGVSLREMWRALEPRQGVFNWSKLDGEVSAAAAHGKKVSLTVTPGLATPPWVYRAGVARFSFTWDEPWGFPPCSRVSIPIPWDPVYLSKWTEFVRALGRRYSGNPAVVRVALTGINAQTSELMLPHPEFRWRRPASMGGGCAGAGDETRAWQQAGYTRSKIESAWRTIADGFAQAFPGKSLVLPAVRDGLPPIDDGGNVIAGARGDSKGLDDLIAMGIRSYGRRFVVANGGLSARYLWPELPRLAERVTVGYQMGWMVTGDPRCRMNRGMSPCDPSTVLRAAVGRGIRGGATFLEIYVADLQNPALQSIIADAHERLARSR